MNDENIELHGMYYDLDETGTTVHGRLCLEDGRIECYANDKLLWSRPAGELRDLKLTALVGCNLIECTENGEDSVLCRLTMRDMKRAAEFCKMVNYYNETGRETDMRAIRESYCPKCGKPYPYGSEVCVFCANKTKTFMRLLGYLGPYRNPMIISGIMLTISNILYLAFPILNQQLIDNYLKPRKGTAWDIILIAIMMLAARGAGQVMYIISSRISVRAGSGFSNRLRNIAYEKIQLLSLSSMSKKNTGDLLKRITQDTQRIRDFITDQGRWAFEQAAVFVVVAVILIVTNPILALMVFVPVPFALYATAKLWRFTMIRYNRQWRLYSRSNAILHDIIKGIRVVKSFGNEEREIKKFGKTCKDLADISAKNEQLYSIVFPIIGFIIGFGEFFVLYFGGEAVLGKSLTIGELVKFTMYIAYIYGPLRWVSMFPRWFADTMTSVIKLFEIYDEEPEITNVHEARDMRFRGEVQFSHVTFGYKAYEPVLKDIDIRIEPGEMIGVVGHSGVGKSTFINLLLRLYDVNEGQILIDDVDIRDISLSSLHENIGVVFQETFLFAGSIYDNIVYAKPDVSREEVIAAAKIANAHDFISVLPDGYNTLVGENGYSLSGGERQRVAIARAILRNPTMLILDEATSSLDVETESIIQEAMGRLIKGRTTIAIAHRLSTLRNADRLFVFDKGQLAEVGTHLELIRKKGIYYKLVMAQRQTAKLKEEVAAAV